MGVAILTAGEGNSTTPPAAGFPVTACGRVPPTVTGVPPNVNARPVVINVRIAPGWVLKVKPPVASEGEDTVRVDRLRRFCRFRRLRRLPSANGTRAADGDPNFRPRALNPEAGEGVVLARTRSPKLPRAAPGVVALYLIVSAGVGVGFTASPLLTPIEEPRIQPMEKAPWTLPLEVATDGVLPPLPGEWHTLSLLLL